MERQMAKKIVPVLIITALAAGRVFAQTDFETMPKNTITVDFGPAIAGVAIAGMGYVTQEEEIQDIRTSGFGLSAQYERQMHKRVSLVGRFVLLGGGMGITIDEGGARSELGMHITSFCLEGHVRYFPLKGTFFLDGMLGYANLSSAFSGDLAFTNNDTGISESESIPITIARNYVKFGAKLGWRIDFGNPGGFTFEPSFGYCGGIGLGDTIGENLARQVKGNVEAVDKLFTIFEDFIFIGGPRVTLSCGWRF